MGALDDLDEEDRFEARLRENLGLDAAERKRRLANLDAKAKRMPDPCWRLFEEPAVTDDEDGVVQPDCGSTIPSARVFRVS